METLGVFVTILGISGSLFTLLGAFTFWLLFIQPKRKPMDESNRINHVRLWWWALTRPELFVATFPWLQNDELENIVTK